MTEEQKQKIRDRIGLRIASLRKMQGMTITQLAERAGVGRGHLSRIEAGKYAVTLETIEAIAEALGMTVDIVDGRLRDLAPLRVMTGIVTAEPRPTEKRGGL
jgi:transcriptional regulator with XRE-family HTH domain